MNDFWTASVTPGDRGPSNETWQNGDICRNIGYSLRPRHLALSLCVSPPLPLARLTRPDCLRPLKHLFQLALPSWPRGFKFSWCHLHITLNQKKKKETKPYRHGSGKGAKALYKTEMWQTLNWIVHVCKEERYEDGGENNSKWNRERESGCALLQLSHIYHTGKKANIPSACWYEWWVLLFKANTT